MEQLLSLTMEWKETNVYVICLIINTLHQVDNVIVATLYATLTKTVRL